MTAPWQDSWTFRIVDQDTGAAVAGVPFTVLPEGKDDGGYWVSDADGLVRVPKTDHARLRLRVGLRNEEVIELDARALGDDPVSLAAPRGGPVGVAEPAPRESGAAHRAPAPASARPGQILRFARLAVLPEDQDVIMTPDPTLVGATGAAVDSSAVRYGVVLEVDAVWQSQGAEAGELLYTVSLGPGEEMKLVVADGRWRKKPDARERPLQIVARMVAARQLADSMDALPLDPCVASDLKTVAGDTVRLLSERTTRAAEALRHRPLGVTELAGDPAPGASVRTVRNLRSEGVLSYHLVEPVERHHVIVRTPRLRPAVLVPFRLPNIATRDVVRRFGHALRRAALDRAFGPDIDQVLAGDPPADVERRLYEHISAHLPYYSATIIAAGDPAERFFALAKLLDPEGRPLTDVIENVVVGRVGNYVAFALRSIAHAPAKWRALLTDDAVRQIRVFQESSVTLPIPGVWLRSELFPATVVREEEAAEEGHESKKERRKRS
ncbi:MAG TPA: hypothetical protein VFK78_08705 [Gemmatimonadales bacterium]|nr:hypothetical protein [Gemmatimonadales bacterium]